MPEVTKRSYVSKGKITCERLKNYDNYDKELYLKRVIAHRLEEGWTHEEILVKYRRDAASMCYFG